MQSTTTTRKDHMLPSRVRALVIRQADAFYSGETSSVDAYAVIDRAANSAWNYFPGIVNETRRVFDERVNLRIERAAR